MFLRATCRTTTLQATASGSHSGEAQFGLGSHICEAHLSSGRRGTAYLAQVVSLRLALLERFPLALLLPLRVLLPQLRRLHLQLQLLAQG